MDLLPIRTSRGLVELLGQGERRESCHSRGAAPIADSYDNALAETVNGLYKTELISHIDAELPNLSRNLAGLHNIGAGLEARVTKATSEFMKRHPEKADLVAGLFPRASGVADPDVARALAEREQAMEDRAGAVLQRALARQEPWTARLGAAPTSPALRAAWEHQARSVAAYRDLHRERGDRALPRLEDCTNVEQLAHWHRARRALDACQRLSAMSPPEDETVGTSTIEKGMEMGF